MVQWQQQPAVIIADERNAASRGSHSAQNRKQTRQRLARCIRDPPAGRACEQHVVQVDLGSITVVLSRLFEVDTVRVDLTLDRRLENSRTLGAPPRRML